MSQYVHDNTDDGITHHAFLNAFLAAIGATPVDLSPFATLTGSQATGANKTKKRLTNLTKLTVDTSWWTRYRSSTHNPDLDPTFVFPQVVPTLNTGHHNGDTPTDADTTDPTQIQAIANTAAFHFGFIEQGGTSIYPTLALRVTDPTVLRVPLSIGPSETITSRPGMTRRATRSRLLLMCIWRCHIECPFQRGGPPAQLDDAEPVRSLTGNSPRFRSFARSRLPYNLRCGGGGPRLYGRRLHRPNSDFIRPYRVRQAAEEATRQCRWD